jgi:hypothetical protein
MRRCSGWLKNAGVTAAALAVIVPAALCAGTIGDKGYHAVVLERRNAVLGRSVDALVLTAGGGHRFIRRLDENYRLVLNATSGAQAPEVTPADLSFYDAMIKENHLIPRAIRDNSGREVAVVYCGLNPCYIDHRIRPDGTILLDVRGKFFADPELRGGFGRSLDKE